MSKISVADAAEHFGVSREAIHNRIRRGSLESVIENGVKLVIVDTTTKAKPRTPVKKTVTRIDDKYHKFLEEQNTQLQERVEKLENETRTLRDQKEQMLIDERIMIEQIYKDKDEQLKNILNSFKAQFMISSSPQIVEEEHVEAEIEMVPTEPKDEKLIALKKYLKENDYSKKKIEKVLQRFKKHSKKDEKIIKIDKKFYLDLVQYNYDDLLK